MPRSRRTPAPRPAADLALPHERDERIQRPPPARTVIKQAARDVNAGLIDTDNYTRAAAVTAVAAPTPARRRRRT